MLAADDLVPQPWEQLSDESEKAFAAFVLYRDLPASDRSYRAAAALGKGRGSLDTTLRRFERWASDHLWRERAQQWDQYRDRQMRIAQIRAAQEMGVRHADAAMKVIETGLDALRTIKPEHLSGSDVLRYIEVGIKLERLARGEVDPSESTSEPEEAPQETIRQLLEADPELARLGARFGSQILRVTREREAG